MEICYSHARKQIPSPICVLNNECFYSCSVALPRSADSPCPAPQPAFPLPGPCFLPLALLFIFCPPESISVRLAARSLMAAICLSALLMTCPAHLSSFLLVAQLPGPWGIIISDLTNPTNYHAPNMTSLILKNSGLYYIKNYNHRWWKKSDSCCLWGRLGTDWEGRIFLKVMEIVYVLMGT